MNGSWLLIIGVCILFWAGVLYWLITTLNCSISAPCGM